VARVDLDRMLKHWSESMNHEVKHVPLMLVGRFKQVERENMFCQPLAHTTKGGMNIAKWFERTMKLYSMTKTARNRVCFAQARENVSASAN